MFHDGEKYLKDKEEKKKRKEVPDQLQQLTHSTL
jgi:hypothetical protein